MKFLKFLFNKFIFVTLAILAQLAVSVLLVVGLMDYWIFLVVSAVVSVTTFLRVNMRDINPAQQILWVSVMLLLPVVGLVLYVMIGDAKWTKKQRAFIDFVASKQGNGRRNPHNKFSANLKYSAFPFVASPRFVTFAEDS